MNTLQNPLAKITLLGQPPVSGLVRLNGDGSLDQDFQIPELIVHPTTLFQNGIWAPIVLDDAGNIYIGGAFGTVNGKAREGFARLFPDGSLDLNYGASGYIMTGGRPVRGIGFQSDGSLVIGGRFEDDFGTEVVLIWLDPNGDFDPSFVLTSRFDVADTVAPVFPQTRNLRIASDDKIVIVGTTFARFNSDGSLDGTFAQPALGDPTVYNEAFSLVLLPDDSVVFPGGINDIPEVNGVALSGLGRLTTDGTFDETFTPGNFQTEWYPEGFAAQSDGRVVVWDNYDFVENERRDGLARFETDGTLDGTYDLSVTHPDLIAVVDAGMLSDDRLQYIADTDAGKVYGRLNADGTPDDGTASDTTAGNVDFIPDVGISGTDIFVLADDRSIIYTSDNPQSVLDGALGSFQRVNLDGAIDGSFAGPVLNIGSVVRFDQSQADIDAGISGPIDSITTAPVRVLAELAGGKLLLMVPNESGGMQLVRLNSDGTLDNSFVSSNVEGGELNLDFPTLIDPERNNEVLQIAVFSPSLAGFMGAVELIDGSILVSGQFEF